ncbi:uncharacterized protein LOC119683049 [Teleopsis dalmanni]|uniref:uncharacterized protein LOC119683049 n=1 Tax=Teleopsis dalmanni TaxID=139649 RepID=UPI0018CDC0AD|nr:uncharacterized protein LOC119683049 [Teleopsis dalmanni]
MENIGKSREFSNFDFKDYSINHLTKSTTKYAEVEHPFLKFNSLHVLDEKSKKNPLKPQNTNRKPTKETWQTQKPEKSNDIKSKIRSYRKSKELRKPYQFELTMEELLTGRRSQKNTKDASSETSKLSDILPYVVENYTKQLEILLDLTPKPKFEINDSEAEEYFTEDEKMTFCTYSQTDFPYSEDEPLKNQIVKFMIRKQNQICWILVKVMESEWTIVFIKFFLILVLLICIIYLILNFNIETLQGVWGYCIDYIYNRYFKKPEAPVSMSQKIVTNIWNSMRFGI